MTSRTRRASSTTNTDRTSSTPTASRSSIICRSSPNGGRTSIACAPMVRGQLVPIPINRTTLNELFDARPEDRRRCGRVSRLARRAGRRDHDLRGRGHQRRRARALRAVLPRLHAQAMGPRSERARQAGHLAHSDADQHRRPLFQRHVPGDAARRLHQDVRADARQSADRQAARRPTSATSRTARSSSPITSSTPGRSTNISTSASASCPIAA